jgi:integrase
MPSVRRSVRGSGSVTRTANGKQWRLRYWAGGRRRSKSVVGSKLDATRELRRLLDCSGPEPSRMIFSVWKTEWLALKARGIKARTFERYQLALTQHVDPIIGNMPLQKLTARDIDRVYTALALAPGHVTLIATTLKSCFQAAVKKGLIAANPCTNAERPGGLEEPEEADTDVDGATLVRLVDAFRDHPSMADLVAVAAGTGMRRGELLALQWPAIDFSTGAIHVTKNVEPSTRFGLRLTTSKSKRSRRSFQADTATLAVLRRVQEQQKRIVVGVPDGVDVDMSLVRLPDGAMCFPAVGPDVCAIRHPDSISSLFAAAARERGFAGIRFHDIRSGHETALLDAGIPVHVVAERCGHDPAVLLKFYARRTARNDAAAAQAIGDILSGRANLGPNAPQGARKQP